MVNGRRRAAVMVHGHELDLDLDLDLVMRRRYVRDAPHVWWWCGLSVAA